jgi:hypothetical protein
MVVSMDNFFLTKSRFLRMCSKPKIFLVFLPKSILAKYNFSYLDHVYRWRVLKANKQDSRFFYNFSNAKWFVLTMRNGQLQKDMQRNINRSVYNIIVILYFSTDDTAIESKRLHGSLVDRLSYAGQTRMRIDERVDHSLMFATGRMCTNSDQSLNQFKVDESWRSGLK